MCMVTKYFRVHVKASTSQGMTQDTMSTLRNAHLLIHVPFRSRCHWCDPRHNPGPLIQSIPPTGVESIGASRATSSTHSISFGNTTDGASSAAENYVGSRFSGELNSSAVQGSGEGVRVSKRVAEAAKIYQFGGSRDKGVFTFRNLANSEVKRSGGEPRGAKAESELPGRNGMSLKTVQVLSVAATSLACIKRHDVLTTLSQSGKTTLGPRK